MAAKTKLELTWIGKDNRPRLEPRILIEEPEFSYHAKARREGDIFDNLLIQGDNLLALKALETDPTVRGKVKCVFIDPPYNTGSAFEHYDDGLEHSMWLGMMRDRLAILRNIMSDDGSIWITIDDNESHYLKIVCDEIFGRGNFVSNVIWAKRTSPANDAKYFSSDHDNIIVFAKSISEWKINRLARTEKQNTFYKNPDDDKRGPWNSVTYTGNKNRNERPNLYYAIKNPNTGEEIFPPDGLTWRYGKETHLINEAEKRLYWGKDGTSRNPRMKMFLSDAGLVVPRSIWPSDEVGSTQVSMNEQKALSKNPFSTPRADSTYSGSYPAAAK